MSTFNLWLEELAMPSQGHKHYKLLGGLCGARSPIRYTKLNKKKSYDLRITSEPWLKKSSCAHLQENRVLNNN